MWTREELKSNAKSVLSRYYWMAVATCLISSIISSAISSIYNFISVLDTTGRILVQSSYGKVTSSDISGKLTFLWYVSLLFVIFVGNPLIVGLNRYFMESRSQISGIGTLFYAFKNGRYLKVIKVMLIVDVKVFLWMLLLVVPGIVKSYEYYFVSYILAENSDLETNRYFEISKAMTSGEKANIFVLDLSFWGWVLLGVLLCGIGTFFVTPYIQATYAELYALMRAKALSFNFVSPYELPDFTSQQFS